MEGEIDEDQRIDQVDNSCRRRTVDTARSAGGGNEADTEYGQLEYECCLKLNSRL